MSAQTLEEEIVYIRQSPYWADYLDFKSKTKKGQEELNAQLDIMSIDRVHPIYLECLRDEVKLLKHDMLKYIEGTGYLAEWNKNQDTPISCHELDEMYNKEFLDFYFKFRSAFESSQKS